MKTDRYDVSNLPNDNLLSGLKTLVGNNCQLIADMIAHIGETEARKLYLDAACPSMYAYCKARLHMSDGAAYNRVVAARAARQFPSIFEYVASGALHLTAVKLLAPRLTPENHEELLSAAAHLSKREVQRLVAARFPRPDVPTVVRELPEGVMPGAPDTAASRTEVTPLSAKSYSISGTMSEDMHTRLLELQALMRHRIPSGELMAVLDYAIQAGLREVRSRKFGETRRPRKHAKPPRKGSRRVPNALRRARSARDGGQCTFVDDQGRRCQERGFLEFDHVQPFARGGGAASLDDLRLLCRAHNLHAAEQAFGKEFIRRKIAKARSRRTPTSDGARSGTNSGAQHGPPAAAPRRSDTGARGLKTSPSARRK